MMDKEILDEIETSWMNEGHLVKIDREHFDWLIKQIKILQQEKDEWFKKYKQADATTLMQYKQLEKANAEIQRLNDVINQLKEATESFLDDKHYYMEELRKANAKIERYEKALETIAEHQYYGSIGAIGYYAEFKSIAKQALGESE